VARGEGGCGGNVKARGRRTETRARRGRDVILTYCVVPMYTRCTEQEACAIDTDPKFVGKAKSHRREPDSADRPQKRRE